MIIILRKADVNTIAANSLGKAFNMPVGCFPETTLANINGNRIILLDLTATINTQAYLSPEYLSKWLIKKGLPGSIDTIDVYVSDIYSKNSSILTFSYNLCSYLRDHYKRYITVRYVSDENYSFTILVPPHLNDSKKWVIIGLKAKQELAGIDDILLRAKDKEILLESETIDTWLNEKEHKLSPKDIPPDIYKDEDDEINKGFVV